jgi:hypothetical protein
VSRCDDLGDQRRPALDLLADQEEGRRRPALAQDLEHCRRTLRVGAVIEGQGDPIADAQSHFDAKRGAEPRHDRRQRRTGVQDRGRRGAGP